MMRMYQVVLFALINARHVRKMLLIVYHVEVLIEILKPTILSACI